jgi:hypothetical protein
MSTEKITPVPRVKGTPKRMQPPLLRVSYYLVAILGILHILAGLYLYYEAVILNNPAPLLSLQPAALDSVIEFFSGIFAIVAVFGTRRMEYWGALSVAIFGVFEAWNASLLSQIIQYALSTSLGVAFASASASQLSIVFDSLGVIVVLLAAISILLIRRHRRIAGLMKG